MDEVILFRPKRGFCLRPHLQWYLSPQRGAKRAFPLGTSLPTSRPHFGYSWCQNSLPNGHSVGLFLGYIFLRGEPSPGMNTPRPMGWPWAVLCYWLFKCWTSMHRHKASHGARGEPRVGREPRVNQEHGSGVYSSCWVTGLQCFWKFCIWTWPSVCWEVYLSRNMDQAYFILTIS